MCECEEEEDGEDEVNDNLTGEREYNNECEEEGEEDGNNPLLQFKLLFGL